MTDSLSCNTPEYLAYLKAALALSDDNAVTKAQLMQSIVRSQSYQQRGKNHSTQQLAGAIELAYKAALFAEDNKLSDAYQFWIDLAGLEIKAKKMDEALSHARTALPQEALRAEYEYSPIMLRTQKSLTLALSFAGAGETKKAELLLQELVDEASRRSGPKSLFTQARLADQFDFYIRQKNRIKALEVLEIFLKCDITIGGNYIRSWDTVDRYIWFSGSPKLAQSEQVLSTFRSIILRYTATTNSEFALSALNKILNREKQLMHPDDRRIAATLASIAQAHYLREDYADAEKYYQQSIAIFAKYDSEREIMDDIKPQFDLGRIGGNYDNNYYAVLKKLGKEKDVDSSKKRISDDEKLGKIAYIRAQQIQAEKKVSAVKTSNKGGATSWSDAKLYEIQKKKKLYGFETRKSLELLLTAAKHDNNWQILARYTPDQVVIEELTSGLTTAQKQERYKTIEEYCQKAGNSLTARK